MTEDFLLRVIPDSVWPLIFQGPRQKLAAVMTLRHETNVDLRHAVKLVEAAYTALGIPFMKTTEEPTP